MSQSSSSGVLDGGRAEDNTNKSSSRRGHPSLVACVRPTAPPNRRSRTMRLQERRLKKAEEEV